MLPAISAIEKQTLVLDTTQLDLKFNKGQTTRSRPPGQGACACQRLGFLLMTIIATSKYTLVLDSALASQNPKSVDWEI